MTGKIKILVVDDNLNFLPQVVIPACYWREPVNSFSLMDPRLRIAGMTAVAHAKPGRPK